MGAIAAPTRTGLGQVLCCDQCSLTHWPTEAHTLKSSGRFSESQGTKETKRGRWFFKKKCASDGLLQLGNRMGTCFKNNIPKKKKESTHLFSLRPLELLTITITHKKDAHRLSTTLSSSNAGGPWGSTGDCTSAQYPPTPPRKPLGLSPTAHGRGRNQ